jgi:type 2 lantibiotic biosynthesis protein LanM
MDFSGLGGDRGAPSPIEIVEWEAAGTDEMRLVRRPGRARGAENRPSLAGVVAEPTAFVDHLQAGFRDGYDTIAANRAALVAQLARFAHDVVRVVLRPTQLYSTLLDESTHPDVMGDARERDAILNHLRDGASYVDDELADLWAGDVPYFSSRPDGTDLWSSTDRRIPDVLTEPMMARVTAAIESMSPARRREQEWVIRAALASRASGDPHATTLSSGPTTGGHRRTGKDRLLAAACGVADIFAATAYRGDGRANWLGLELQGDRFWQLAPLGAALGNGYCGPALFLAQMWEITGDARHADLARRAIAGLPRLLEQLAGHPDLDAVGSGGFAGLGGIAYAIAQLARRLDDPGIAEWIEPAVGLVCAAAAVEAEAGVVGGTAGGLAALVAVHELTGMASAWTGAQQCAQRLLTHPLPAEPGFAAGSAGVGWALLRFGAAGGGDHYWPAGLAALRAASSTPLTRVSWCRGRTGVALACADAQARSGDPTSAAEATSAGDLADAVAAGVRAAVDYGRLADHSLCHGELGQLMLIGETGAGAAPLARRVDELVESVRRTGFRCATPHGVPSPGLLTGLAGIGHGLLRLAFPERFPSVLLLRA